MSDEPAEFEVPTEGLPDWVAIEVNGAILDRLDDFRREEIQKDIKLAQKAELDPTGEALLQSLIKRAKWSKLVDMACELNKLFEKRYADGRGELMLLQEVFGDQLGMPPMLNAKDVKQRLEWYKRRLGKEFERRIDQRIFDKTV